MRQKVALAAQTAVACQAVAYSGVGYTAAVATVAAGPAVAVTAVVGLAAEEVAVMPEMEMAYVERRTERGVDQLAAVARGAAVRVVVEQARVE